MHRLVPLASVLVAAAPHAASALERALPLAARTGLAPDGPDRFTAASTVEIAYYNTCTGWIWLWSGVPPDATYGVRWDDPSPGPDLLLRTHLYYARGAPAGYGYTVLAQVLAPWVDNCPALSSRAYRFFLPADGWNTIEWGTDGVPLDGGWVLVDHAKTPGDPTVIATEKGVAGGPRPGGCGTCFPPERAAHSYQFGATPEIQCPGAPWQDDSDCRLELLWSAEFRTAPVSVTPSTWGGVKALYR